MILAIAEVVADRKAWPLAVAFAAPSHGRDDLALHWPVNDEACPTEFGGPSNACMFQVVCKRPTQARKVLFTFHHGRPCSFVGLANRVSPWMYATQSCSPRACVSPLAERRCARPHSSSTAFRTAFRCITVTAVFAIAL
jgi:hypothetical protein